jgi:hypothetical protein
LKEDGLAIFVEKKKFDIHHVHHIEFDNAGDRVAMMMHVATKWNRNEASLHQRVGIFFKVFEWVLRY